MEHNENELPRLNLLSLLDDFIREAKRLLILGLVLVILCAAGLTGYQYSKFTPVYEAYASFTVRVANPMYANVHSYNATTAEQMAKTFPYILSSGVLNERVKAHLGVSYLPGISADVMPSSNIFTLRVRDTDPEWANEVLNAVITCYPEVADFVVGPTVMVLLDETGVPQKPVNSFSLSAGLKQGLLVGLGIWVLIVLAMTVTKSTIHDEEELKRLLSCTCLGNVPMIRASAKYPFPLLHEIRNQGGFSESIRLIRLRLEKELVAQEKKVVLISSAIPGEGKTTVSVNLAISLAQRGKKVLLVDCDMRNPSVAKNLRMHNQKGFSEYLVGEISAQGLIQETKVDNLYVIPGGFGGKGSHVEKLSGQRSRQLIQAVSRVYDYVILDTPPCSLLADASEIAELADCALLVIRQDFASQDQVLDGVQSLSDSGIQLLGCVLNGVQAGLHSYYNYGYGYTYGRKS